MLRFGAADPEKPRRLFPARARVWHLVFMLVMTVLLMIWMAVWAYRADAPGEPIRDLSGTSVVTESPSTSRADQPSAEDEAETIRMIELSRLREFVDHERDLAAEPYYYSLDLARHNPPEWLEEHGRRDLTWAQLFRDPEKYRGQLVLLRGRLRRLIRDDVDANDYGLTSRYEGWLYTEDSGKYAYCVIVTDPPTGMPLGAINESVAVAGYFLGWWRHKNQDDKLTSSPVILGHRFVWHEQPERPDVVFARSHGLAIGVAVAIVLLVFFVAFFARRKRRSPVASALERDLALHVFEEHPAGPAQPNEFRGDPNLN